MGHDTRNAAAARRWVADLYWLAWLLRLPTFFARMHGPSMGNTLGAGCILLASMLVSSALLHRPIVHEILITLFIVITAPVTAMMLMRAAIYRSKAGAKRG